MKRVRRSDKIWMAITLPIWAGGFVFCLMTMLRPVVFMILLLTAPANSDGDPVVQGLDPRAIALGKCPES